MITQTKSALSFGWPLLLLRIGDDERDADALHQEWSASSWPPIDPVHSVKLYRYAQDGPPTRPPGSAPAGRSDHDRHDRAHRAATPTAGGPPAIDPAVGRGDRRQQVHGYRKL